MEKNLKVLIIGGVAGGASTAARLRRNNESAEIIIFERGEYISFANCGLPYYIGDEITDKSALTLQTPESFKARFNIDVRVFSEVISIDKENKKVIIKKVNTNEEYEEFYDNLVISTGADPIIPNINGVNLDKVFKLRNIPDTFKIKDYINNNNPKSVAIIGGGFIGVEMAENLRNLGLEVTIVEMLDQLIAPLDYDMACEVHNHVKSKGVELILKNGITGIEEEKNGLIIKLSEGEIKKDMVIMAIGVKPESKIAKEAGIKLNERGYIEVNENLLTSDSNIYAIGDVIEITNFVTNKKGAIPLAGPANKQGRIVADNICGEKLKFNGIQGSSILKIFDLTVASTGINEKMAKSLNLDYEKSFTYSANHATYYPGAVNMSIKTIFEKTSGKILGAQVVGYDGVDKRCDVIATAIRFGATAYDLTELELCYAPPFSSAKDPVNMAGFVIENILEKKVKIFHWHDIENLQKDNSVILLDTRTKIEFENGNIEKFINIPVDELRERMKELDKSKKIYLTCQIGLRGYIATRILMQNGFDVYNLSGGYRLYNTIFQKKKRIN